MERLNSPRGSYKFIARRFTFYWYLIEIVWFRLEIRRPLIICTRLRWNLIRNESKLNFAFANFHGWPILDFWIFPTGNAIFIVKRRFFAKRKHVWPWSIGIPTRHKWIYSSYLRYFTGLKKFSSESATRFSRTNVVRIFTQVFPFIRSSAWFRYLYISGLWMNRIIKFRNFGWLQSLLVN